MSSRRVKQDKLADLAELKRVREGGRRKLKEEEDVDIYDEVTDDQYKSIVKGRLQKDDFVVDDGVDGYMDNGMDDWDDREEESEEEIVDKKKKGKKRADAPTKAKSKPKAPPPPPTNISAYRTPRSDEQEADFMQSLLGTYDAPLTIATPINRSRKRKPSPSPEPIPSYRSEPDLFDTSSDGPYEELGPTSSGDDRDFDQCMSPKKKARVNNSDYGVTPAVKKMHRLDIAGPDDSFNDQSFNDIDMDAFMKVDEEELLDTRGSKPVLPPPVFKPTAIPEKKKEEDLDAVPAWLSEYESLATTKDDTLGKAPTGAAVQQSNISALEPDGSLRFFWLDYMENEGKIYFIGKLKDKTSGTWVSCCVTVEGLQRNLFVLPREKRVEEDEDGDMVETDVVPGLPDVYQDFDRVRKKVGIKSWKAKFVDRKYAFGETDVPRGEAKWMKVVYGFDEPPIPSAVSSPNFSRVFGTSTSAFELLVMKRKIMGPCWLQIKNPKIDNKGVSWCKIEATVSDPKDINPFLETDQAAPKEIPPLTIMSLSVRTIVNHQENKREVVCVTARIWSNIHIDDPTPPEQLPCSVHTFVRPLDRFPPGFDAQAGNNKKGTINPSSNERMLLSSLLVTIHKADPDVIVGHDFLGVSLDVLLNRMRDLKADHWSRLGRFRRSKWPNIGRQGTNMKFINGRLLCDLASDAAKGMISSTTWSLTEMCKTHLKSDRQEIEPDDTASYLDGSVSSPARLMTFVKHCELDAHYQMAIAFKVQILPLTRQLTNLAGNSWNKTLNGGRAERNEYILLHEFHRLKYICPDKMFGKKTKAAPAPAEDGKTVKKRDKYKGGLVFEPKRGLWDKYILVMDFNSLYPSIIQEYNIDFTTVDKVEDDEEEDKIPEPPSSEIGQGVLPRLIATLVNRRKQVKNLMKDRTITVARRLQCDIKQQALKLTANSMYGCLGFEYSRFYARPLAALTTFKGREILTHTRELAESLGLDVVYGDTDSVFVNSNVTELSEALKISAEFKKAVNDRYKLLEIDLDGIFQRLLLLQKKKYAAIKVEEGDRTSVEIKGLDMKRREYCILSKNVSQYVLEQILSGAATEEVVANIHEYLTTVGENVREGKTPVENFIVLKRLGKNPEDYPDVKSQPHVQVALRMKQRGGNARLGDVIPYVFCLSEGEQTAKTAQADRAKHPEELRKAGAELKIDYEHYLSQQVLPPIERLCEPIEGTDRSRLAECLGLDPARYRNSASGESEERSFSTLDSLISDTERFKEARPFIVRCRKCEHEQACGPLHNQETSVVQAAGPICLSCQQPLSSASLQMQLERHIRVDIAKYYEGWLVCDDQTCGNRTRMMGVYGRRCLRPGCQGSVSFEYSDADLYTQLRYYSHLFDGEKAHKSAVGAIKQEDVKTVVDQNTAFLKLMADIPEKYLHESGRRWVDMASLFSFQVGR